MVLIEDVDEEEEREDWGRLAGVGLNSESCAIWMWTGKSQLYRHHGHLSKGVRFWRLYLHFA